MIKRCEGELERLNARRVTIEKEIINCLMGESKLTAEALNPMLNDIRNRIDATEKVMADLQREKDNEESHLQFLTNQYQCIMEWADSYDLMQQDEKKMVLAHLIERIEVCRGYHITVKFYVALEDFQKNAAEEKIRIEESPKTYFSTAL